MNRLIFCFCIFIFALCHDSRAQSGRCDPLTPFYNVNLVGNPGGTWISNPPVVKKGFCCDASGSDKCIEFSILLDTLAVAINFQIASGAVPPGALFYQIGCGPPVQVGQPICVTGRGPHTITFCKPGNNQNTYSITSIPGPAVSPNVTTSDGCNVLMGTIGIELNSITWNSISPGAIGQYNNYLACPVGCDTTTVTPLPGYPAFVDYKMCGTPTGGVCVSSSTFCDTLRATFVPPLANSITPNPASFCVNQGGVTLTGVINGGAPTYQYIWTNSAGVVVGNSINYFATAAGAYTLEVRDTTYPSCPAKFTTANVTIDPLPIANAGQNVTVCPGNTTVTLAGTLVNATGGIWSGGTGTFSPNKTTLNATYTPSLAEVATGSVTLTLTTTGNKSCSPATDQMTITITSPLSVSLSPPAVVCYGQKGTLTAIVSGGTPPYSYLWNTGATTQTVSNLTPNQTYSVTVKDATAKQCTIIASIFVSQNPQVTVTVPSNSIISCDATATINITANGGGGNFSYLWNTGATTPSITTNSGTYIITATDINGCSAKDTVVIQAAGTSITVTLNDPPVLCNAATTTLSATASGGFGGYTYLWTPSSATTSSIAAGSGNHCVTVRDVNNCTTTACEQVIASPPITISIPAPSKICNGDSASITATASGGQPPFTYLWNTGETTKSIIKPAGTYTVTVTDANPAMCTATKSVTITHATPLNLTIGSTEVSCFGGNNGTATVAVFGGTPPYDYSWSPYGGAGATAYSLTTGTYTVTINDALNCFASASVNIIQPSLLNASITNLTNISCYGSANGSASVSATGGKPSYTYNWFPGGSTGSSVIGLNAGNNSVVITDSKGCTKSVSFLITQPGQLSATITNTTPVSCNSSNNGSATVTGGGGSPPYTYSWPETGDVTPTASNLFFGTYNVSVIDNLGCVAKTSVTITQPPLLTAAISGSTNIDCYGVPTGSASVSAAGGKPGYAYSWMPSGGNGPTANSLSANTYTVTVTDANTCTSTAAVTITQPAARLTLSATAIPASCNAKCDGSAIVIPDGGTAPYNYQWIPTGNTTSSNNNLCAGTYTVLVTDKNGCKADTILTVTEPPTINISITNLPANCGQPNGSASATATGGKNGFTYSWTTNPIQNFATATSIVPGTYSVTATDMGGCTQVSSVTIANIPGPVATITSSVNALCKNSCNGSATGSASGGVTPYLYSWNSSPVQNTLNAVNLCAGQYIFSATDAKGCKSSDTVNITEPNLLTSAISASTNVDCYGSATGSATVTATGGTLGYSYLWSPGSITTPFASNLTSNTYTATVTDAKGCTSTSIVTITQPAQLLILSAGTTPTSCNSKCDGSTVVVPDGGTQPYKFLWSPSGLTTQNNPNLCAGSQSVVVTDKNGCVTDTSLIVTEPSTIAINITSAPSNCGQPNGSATASASGGTGSFTYSWKTNPVQNFSTITGQVPGTYTVTATDNRSCTQTSAVTIANKPGVTATITSSTNVECKGIRSGTAIAKGTGGDQPYFYTWNSTPSQSNDTATALCAGTYTLNISDGKGCTSTTKVTITEPASELTSTISSSTNIDCFGNTNGSATVTSAGGTPPYTYSWMPGNMTSPSVSSLSAGTYTATVTDAKLCTSTVTVSITQPAKLLFLSAGAFPASCNGKYDGLTLVIPEGGTQPYTYKWTPSLATTPNNPNLCAGPQTVIVTDKNGCVNDTMLTVTQPDPINISSTNTSSNCNQPNGTCSANAAGGPSGTFSYSWNTTPVQNVPTATSLTPGTYTVTATDNSCTQTAAVTIANIPGVLASITSSTNVHCKDSCTGTATGSGTGGDSPYIYTWNTSPSQNTATATNLCAGTYTFSITDGKGCTSSNTVTITEPSQIIVMPNPPSPVICIGQSQTLSATATGGSGSFTYSWNGIFNGQNYTVTPATTTTYTVVAYDNKGCASVPATVVVTVNSALGAATGTNHEICRGDSAIITATATGGSQNYIFTWSPGGMTGSSVSVKPSITTVYTVTVSDDCGSPTSTATLLVTVNSKPQVSFTATNISGCAPLCVTFTNLTSAGGDSIVAWSWNFGDGNIGTGQNEEHCYNKIDQFTVSLNAISDKGCQQSFTFGNPVIVRPDPIAEFYVSPKTTTILNPLIHFINNSVNDISWTWGFDDINDITATSSIENPNHIYSDTGTYCPTLTVKNSYGCIDDTSMCFYIGPDFTFYIPNAFTPNDDNINDYFVGKGTFIKKYDMWIFDRWGDMIFHGKDLNDGWDGRANDGKRVAQTDVYVYMIKITDINNDKHEFTGHVTLVK